MATLVCAASLATFLFTWKMGALRRVLTPAVGGTVLMLMALSVAPVVWNMFKPERLLPARQKPAAFRRCLSAPQSAHRSANGNARRFGCRWNRAGCGQAARHLAASRPPSINCCPAASESAIGTPQAASLFASSCQRINSASPRSSSINSTTGRGCRKTP